MQIHLRRTAPLGPMAIQQLGEIQDQATFFQAGL